MNTEQFSQSVRDMYERAAELYQRTSTPYWQEPELVADSLEELRIALEELHVAEEEILVQNQELIMTRAQVEAERQRYKDLFELAPDAYIVTDKSGTIYEANQAAAKLLNVSQQFLIGKPLINYIPFEDRQAFRSKLNQLHQMEQVQEWEICVAPRDAAKFDAALTRSAIRDLTGEHCGWRWLIRDITVRKQAEETIRRIQLQNLQLQEAAKLKSHFLAVMSHELRSPMNAIVGFSQLLLRQHHQPLVESHANMVQRILNSGKHLLTLIENILDFSKIEVGQFKLQVEKLNLAELVTATTEELRLLAEQKKLVLQVNFNCQNPDITNDYTRLRQVLTNLVSNAIKFTETGSVQVDVWELSTDKIAIAVKDTGIGIAEADIQYIFEEFRQLNLNQTFTRKYGGTGLGLTITDRLVRMMQGKITVESQCGQGSTFCVEIPRCVNEKLNSSETEGIRAIE